MEITRRSIRRAAHQRVERYATDEVLATGRRRQIMLEGCHDKF